MGFGFGPGFFRCLAGGGGGGGGGGGASAVEEEDVEADSRGEGESEGRGELVEESEDPAITPTTKFAWSTVGCKEIREQRKLCFLFPGQFVARELVRFVRVQGSRGQKMTAGEQTVSGAG